MATETADSGTDSGGQHFGTVTRTTLSAAAGVAAAFVSAWLTGDMAPAAAALHQPAQAVVLVAIAVQPVLQRLLGVYKDDFGAKDFLFIAFMTFSMWFVTWGIMLSAQAN
ncbi:hypothetical protein [Haloarchaeobius amylolyticus]|uniref:EMC6-like membrane protein n=1 Tax=Haloarchaeobius amylolyticus TaxID=1198296 RepID=UPI002271422C|nr:hypothetical protein [Haloarchaeobius amylolyticus]